MFNQHTHIGICAPSSVCVPDALDRGVAFLRDQGFEVTVHPQTYARMAPDIFLAGPISDRVNALHDLYRDDKIDVILAVNGGYGANHLIPHLDWQLIQRHPKPLMGYSDITALLIGLWHQAPELRKKGGVGVHMNMGSELNAKTPPKTINASIDMLSERTHTLYQFHSRVLQTGQAWGHMIGGNLAVLSAMMIAGEVKPKFFDGAILMIEDVDEENSRLDRALAALFQNVNVRNVKAIIVGKTQVKKSISPTKGDFYCPMPDMLRAHTKGTPLADIPIIWDAPFGHEPENLPFIYGGEYDLAVTKTGDVTLGLV